MVIETSDRSWDKNGWRKAGINLELYGEIFTYGQAAKLLPLDKIKTMARIEKYFIKDKTRPRIKQKLLDLIISYEDNEPLDAWITGSISTRDATDTQLDTNFYEE